MRDVKDYSKIKLIAIIVAAVLMVTFVVYLFCLAYINPIERLNRLDKKNDNYRIRTVGFGSGGIAEVTIVRDGNFFSLEQTVHYFYSIDNTTKTKYYETDGEKIYEYTRYKNQWFRNEVDRSTLGINDAMLDSTSDILNPDLYEKDSDEFFGWKIDPYIDLGNYYNVSARNNFASIVIDTGYNNLHMQMTFDSFGTVKLKLPWIEEGATVIYND